MKYAYFKVYPDSGNIGVGADDLHFPPLMRGYNYDAQSGLYVTKPEFVEFFAQIMNGKMIQMHIPIPGWWST
jgi:hypothetical protein